MHTTLERAMTPYRALSGSVSRCVYGHVSFPPTTPTSSSIANLVEGSEREYEAQAGSCFQALHPCFMQACRRHILQLGACAPAGSAAPW